MFYPELENLPGVISENSNSEQLVQLMSWACDSEGNCTHVDESWLSFTNSDSNDALAESRFNFIHPLDLENYKEIYYNALEKRIPFKAEYRLRDSFGYYKWMIDTAAPNYRENHNFSGFVGTTLTIHEEKERLSWLEKMSKEHFDISNNSTVGIFHLDPSNKILWANPSIFSMLGFNGPEFTGHSILDFIDDKQTLSLFYNRHILLKDQKNIQIKLRCSKGLIKCLNVSTNLYKEKGVVIYARCFVQDITDHKLIEERLRERNKTLQILNSIGNSINAKLDLKTLVQSVTDAATGISGAQFGVFYYNKEDSSGISSWEAISGLSLAGGTGYHLSSTIDFSIFKNHSIVRINNAKETYQNSVLSGMPEDFPVRSYMAVPVTSRMGDIIGGIFLGHTEINIFTDVTETFIEGIAAQASVAIDNARLFEAKKAEEQRFRVLAESIPQIIFTAQANGNVDYFNQRWSVYTGFSNADSFGMGWIKAIHKTDLVKSLRTWKEAIESGGVYEMEYRLKKLSDSSFRWHLVRAIPIKDENENLIRWFGTCTDIDDQKKQNQKKDDFISIASHELKTPLTSIKAYVQLLERVLKEKGDDTSKMYISKANTYIDRLTNLIGDLLDVSRIQAGKIEYNMGRFDLAELVSETIESIQHSTRTHEIVSECSGSQWVNGDKQRIEQVLINFLTNAVKYSPQGEKIVVKLDKHRAYACLAVTDFGIGIPVEKLNKVFERFYRVESSATKFTGLGLGLYISAEIIKRHHGKVWVKSEEGKGATFYFTVPLHKD